VDKHPLLHESDALKIYEEATAIDNIPGTYPPDDTGSSGLSVAKVLKNRYFISSYKHAFDVPSALNALMHQAVIMGCCWYEGFDTPDADGIVAMTGQIRGGHEVMSREYEMLGPSPGDDDLVWFDNSWTTSWGVKGRFAMRVSTLRPLLVQQGDITILVP
jgi:hypothetical protein